MSTYYISPTGNDSTGDGSEGNPWLTISKAHTSASNGDTVLCQDGTYTWVSQTFSKSLTIQAVNRSQAIFDAFDTAIEWTLRANISFSGLTFTRAIDRRVFTWPVSDVNANFSNCIFHTIYGAYFNDYFINMRTSGDVSGMSLDLTSCAFYNMWRTDSNLFNVLGSGAEVDYVNITSCIFSFDSDNGTPPSCVVNLGFSPADITIKNSIFFDSSNFGIILAITGGTKLYDYSCASGNFSSIPSGTGNITDDPLFYDPKNGDFELRPTSPCLDVGVLV